MADDKNYYLLLGYCIVITFTHIDVSSLKITRSGSKHVGGLRLW